MSPEIFQVPLAAELVAAGLGGVQGALFAAGHRDRRLDVLGVIVIGIATSLGGSLLRDIVLNQPPVVIWSLWYLPTAAAGALLGMLIGRVPRRVDGLLTVLDALVIGVFGAIGTTKALALGVPVAGAVLVGVIAAVGGSILRDVMVSVPVSFLQIGSLYAVAAGIGAVVLVTLAALGLAIPLSGVIAVAVTASVRLAAVAFGWRFPEQRSLRRAA